MRVSIINIANKMPQWVVSACDEYLKRINHGKYSCQIIEIKAGNFELIKKIILEGQRKNVFRKIDMELTIGTVMGTIAQVTSSRSLYCKLLKIDIKDDDGYRKKMTLKLRTHLKQMLKAHLHIQNT